MSSSTEKRAAVRAEWLTRLEKMRPKQKADALIEDVDGRALVQRLPATDVYSVIIDVGLADSTEIVQSATPEQFRTFVDLAAWQRDRVDVIEVLHWLRAARGDSDDNFDKKVASLDIEVLELLFKRLVVVHDLEENPDVNPEGTTMESPEGKYLIEFKIDGVDEHALRTLTQEMTRRNPFEFARFLEAVKWEMPTELEETAYQFRQSRLEELGFPAFDEAIKLFSWVDPEKHLPRQSVSVSLSKGESIDFVEQAFRGLDRVERESLEQETRYLVNSALVAEGAEPGDPSAIRRISEQAKDYLNLGFEHFTGGDPQKATDVVHQHTLRLIFQVGFSLTLRLKRHVERLSGEVGSKLGDTWLVLDEEAQVLAALLKKRPLKAVKVPGAPPVAFRMKREIVEVENVLQRIRSQRAIFQHLLGSNSVETARRFGPSLAEVTPQRIFAAFVANAEVDGVERVEPFSRLKLTELCERLFEGDVTTAKLRTSAGRRSVSLLTEADLSSGAEAKQMVDRILTQFFSEFGLAYIREGRVDESMIDVLPLVQN